MAVVEIKNPIPYNDEGIPTNGGINDLKMGIMPIDEKNSLINLFLNGNGCQTCHCTSKECPGHFGYIPLIKPVFHVGYIKNCLRLLNCICIECSNLLVTNDEKEELKEIRNPKARQLKIYKICKNKNKCLNDSNHILYSYKKIDLKIYKIEIIDKKSENDISKKQTELKPEEIYEIFSKISDEDCKFLGFDPKLARPEWMIIKNLVVCPPVTRPSVSVDSSLISHDDLTHQYNQILKSNQDLSKSIKDKAPDTILDEKFIYLQKHVAALINNNLSCTKVQNKGGGELIKSIISRLNGKEGRMRGNIMGKRVDYCARTVISPDPNIKVNEVGIPISIAINLTVPEIVNKFNIKKLEDLVKNGVNKYPGAKTIRKNKDDKFDLKYAKDLELKIGDIVERNILNGDYVIFNRQPSLHKMSMMGHFVRVLPSSTFRLNLSVTTPYNADFDGDEMNLHLPQNLLTKAEIMNIMNVSKQVISPQSNRPVMGIVQDSLVGCKLFTSRDTLLTYEQTMSIIIHIDNFNVDNLPIPCILKPKPLWSGKQIFSLILPKNLNFTRYREEAPYELLNKLNLIDNFVEIRKGELIQGIICKKTVGSSCGGGIVHCIWLEDGPESSIQFLYLCQKIVNQYLLSTGFTVGINDILCDIETNNSIRDIIEDMKINIQTDLQNLQINNFNNLYRNNNIDDFELKANSKLYYTCSKAGILAQRALSENNNLKNMVSSGSKGNLINISQIIACVGQQNVEGKRIPFHFKNRTLPHFLENDFGAQSKGFIENSFVKGLTPQEFYFHAMAGREGIIDTAVKTSETGYIQRRLEKLLEDIIVNYDGTVINSMGNIIQFIYGEDGMAGEYIEDQKFETLKMDDDDLEKNYKFFVNNNTNIDELTEFMENSTIESIRHNIQQLKNLLDDEYKQIKIDRNEVRKNILTNNDDLIHIPINIQRIIKNYEIKFNINKFSKSDLNPFEVIHNVRNLKDELKIIKGDDIISKESQECALNLLNKVLNYSLSTKNLIFKHRLNKEAFKNICKEIKKRFNKSIINPGEMVGSIASQSIGEPTTQMTLNTFHLAGISSANVTLGIPRLKEIINNSKIIQTPSMSIYLKEKENKYSDNDLMEIISKIEHFSLFELIQKSDIYYDPDINNTQINEDIEMINDYMEICGEEISKMKKRINPWVLRLVFDKNKMINIKMNSINNIIYKLTDNNCLIIHTTEFSDEKKMQIRLLSKLKKPKKGKKNQKNNEEEEYIEETEENKEEQIKKFRNKLLQTTISGIEFIKKLYIRLVDKKEYNEDPSKEYLIETNGSNLLDLFTIDEIDFKRTITNDINDVYKTLGIEATRKIIINEIKKVLHPYGIYINYRHLSILSDLMTNRGFVTSITRQGLKGIGMGPIRKSTFEETSQILLEAGIFSEKDPLKGISENILIGNLAKMGTGFFDLIMNKNIDNDDIRDEDLKPPNEGNSDNESNNSNKERLTKNTLNNPKTNPFLPQPKSPGINPYSPSQIANTKNNNEENDNKNSSPMIKDNNPNDNSFNNMKKKENKNKKKEEEEE